MLMLASGEPEGIYYCITMKRCIFDPIQANTLTFEVTCHVGQVGHDFQLPDNTITHPHFMHTKMQKYSSQVPYTVLIKAMGL